MYYKNIGSLSTPQFQLTNPMLGNIDVSTLTPDGYPTQHFLEFKTQRIYYLVPQMDLFVFMMQLITLFLSEILLISEMLTFFLYQKQLEVTVLAQLLILMVTIN